MGYVQQNVFEKSFYKFLTRDANLIFPKFVINGEDLNGKQCAVHSYKYSYKYSCVQEPQIILKKKNI